MQLAGLVKKSVERICKKFIRCRPEITHPEYIKKMKTMKVAPRTTTEHYKRTQ